mgnify:CR=1 FL=1
MVHVNRKADKPTNTPVESFVQVYVIGAIGRCKVAKLLAVLRSMDLPSSLRCVVASLRHCIVASIVDVDMPKEWSRHGRH